MTRPSDQAYALVALSCEFDAERREVWVWKGVGWREKTDRPLAFHTPSRANSHLTRTRRTVHTPLAPDATTVRSLFTPRPAPFHIPTRTRCDNWALAIHTSSSADSQHTRTRCDNCALAIHTPSSADSHPTRTRCDNWRSLFTPRPAPFHTPPAPDAHLCLGHRVGEGEDDRPLRRVHLEHLRDHLQRRAGRMRGGEQEQTGNARLPRLGPRYHLERREKRNMRRRGEQVELQLSARPHCWEWALLRPSHPMA